MPLKKTPKNKHKYISLRTNQVLKIELGGFFLNLLINVPVV